MRKKKLAPAGVARVQDRAWLDSWTENTLLHVIAILLIVFLAYWKSLEGGFHFDDQGIFLDPYIVNSGSGWNILRLAQTRPLTFLSFHWNYLTSGNSPGPYHLVNVLLHAANSILVMLIARRHVRGALALLAGVLFAVHPLQTQAVNYVFERATLLAAFFALLSLLLFLRDRYPWAVAAFGISLLAKEETIALPAFLLLYDLIRGKRRMSWAHYAAMLVIATLATFRLFYVLQVTHETKLGFAVQGISPISYALTQCRAIWIYLRLFLLPVGLSLEHDISISHSLFSPLTTFPALLLLVLAVGALAWLTWKRHEPALWALGFFVLLSPSSSIVPVEDIMFEHRTYFPLVCLAVAAALLLARLRTPWRTPVLISVPVVLLALLVGTTARNHVWHDDQSLWTDVVEKCPHKARGYFQLAQTYAATNPIRSRQLYERGLEIEPGSTAGRTNLGLLLLSQNDLDGALVHLRQALALGGDNPLVLNNIGVAQLRHGEIDEGMAFFRRALKIDPCRFDARINLTRALVYLGKLENATLAAQAPADCHFLPEQTRKLDYERRTIQ